MKRNNGVATSQNSLQNQKGITTRYPSIEPYLEFEHLMLNYLY